MAEIDVMLKLFDTLKQSSDKNEATIQKLIEQQHALIGHIEYLPIKELQEALKEHDKGSTEDIDSCTETVKTTTDIILEKVNIIDTKVGKMITVVIVAFALLTMSYLFVTSSVQYGHQDLKDEIVRELNEKRSEKP